MLGFKKHITVVLLSLLSPVFLSLGFLHHHDGIIHQHTEIAFESAEAHPTTICLTCNVFQNGFDCFDQDVESVLPDLVLTIPDTFFLSYTSSDCPPKLRAPPTTIWYINCFDLLRSSRIYYQLFLKIINQDVCFRFSWNRAHH